MLARARDEAVSPAEEAERVGWIVAALLPWSAEQRQRLLQNNAPDMRAIALTYTLSRLLSRYIQCNV